MAQRLKSQWLLTFFFVCVFLVAIKTGWEWPYIAKLMPVYIAAVPGLILCLVQLYRDVTAWDQTAGKETGGMDMDEVFEVNLDARTERRRRAFLVVAGGTISIWLWEWLWFL
jgi:hypothetical protein